MKALFVVEYAYLVVFLKARPFLFCTYFKSTSQTQTTSPFSLQVIFESLQI